MTDNISLALDYLDPNINRDEWVTILMAIKSELGDAGYSIAHQWSAKGTNYNKADFTSTWKSISPSGGVTIATLFQKAKENGFTPNYLAPIPNRPTEAEIIAQRQIIEAQAQIEIENKLNKMANFWQMLRAKHPPQPCINHPYLERKRIKPHGVHYLPNWKDQHTDTHGNNPLILWVMRDSRLSGFQLIYPDGFKSFIAGTVKRGGYYMVTRFDDAQTASANKVVLCEGFATACSVLEHHYPDAITYIAFDAGNLPPVARYLRDLYPEKDIHIMADNDHMNEPNTGIEYAKKAVSDCPTVPHATMFVEYPNFPANSDYTDWNDYYNNDYSGASYEN